MSQLRTSSVSHKDATNDNIKLKVDGSSIAGRETVAGDESLTLVTKGYVDANGGGGGGASVSVGEAPPSGASEGDLWWDSSDGGDSNGGRMYVYYSGQWVQSSNVGGSAEGGGGEGGSGSGADAWGSVASDGTLQNGYNVTTSKTGAADYRVDFITPMPSALYGVTTAPNDSNQFVRFQNRTASGFDVRVRGADGNGTGGRAHGAKFFGT